MNVPREPNDFIKGIMMALICSVAALAFAILFTSCSSAPSDPSKPIDPIFQDCDFSKKSSLNSPWKSPSSSIVIDAYEGNPIDWDAMASDKKMVAIIHRSAYGTRVDTKYFERRSIAKARGYLWGAYHLATPGNIEKQADMLIEAAGDDLMVLDLEDTNSSKFASLDEAKKFMYYVHSKTGRIPVVYANHSTTKLINQKFKDDPLFKKARFWYARFKSSVSDFPAGVWGSYFLWQFSSEINCSRTGQCLYNVPGTKYDMDVNVFDGSKSELEAAWGCK